jgi:hypothetical protein
MRCPSCGTDNAPDSRFCGGCGARVGPPEHRVAPTAKISDDTPFAPIGGPPGPAPGTTTIPSPAPPPGRSLPSPMYGSPASRAASEPSVPSALPSASQVRTTPRQISRPSHNEAISPSMSLPASVKRPLGLIAIILVVDVALAIAGTVLLAKGLGSGSRPQATDSVRPSQ